MVQRAQSWPACDPKELQPTKQIIVNNDGAKKVNVHSAVEKVLVLAKFRLVYFTLA